MNGDRLRDELSHALVRAHVEYATDPTIPHLGRHLANAALDKMQARIAVEREQVAHEAWQQGYAAGKEQAAEQIAQAIERERDNERVSDPEWGGLDLAADIARQHAKGDGDG